MVKVRSICALLLIAPAFAWGADVRPGPGVAELLELLLGLLVVIAAVLASSRLLSRLQRGQGIGGAELRVVSSLVVGQKERIVLLQAGKTQLLVGVTSAHVATLHVLEEPIDVTAPAPGVVSGSYGWLQKVLVKKS